MTEDIPAYVERGQVYERIRDGAEIVIGQHGTSSNEWRWRDRFGSGGVIFQHTLLDPTRYRLKAVPTPNDSDDDMRRQQR